jgi:hypothetical protein
MLYPVIKKITGAGGKGPREADTGLPAKTSNTIRRGSIIRVIWREGKNDITGIIY